MHDRRQLGKFEVLSRLSTGGMSEIYLANQAGLAGFRKLVVLKTILPDISDEDDFVRMFLDEARITASFNHPNIAQVYELDVDNGTLFMAMEFVQGCTLVEMARACRTAKEAIPIGFSLMSVRDTALALNYAHTYTDPRGRKQVVIHRDVAEKNIMVTYEGVTKLLDFGIAKATGRSNRTSIGMVKGTSGYMSPEQIKGEPLDGRSDIFSLGVVLHECLTGMRLFFGKSAQDGMMAVLRDEIPPPSRLNPEVTRDIDGVVLKALARNREERFGTALEFARAIEKAAPGAIWHPEQTAELVQKHFTTRRAETRRLIEAAAFGGDSTGEISISHVMQKVRAGTPAGSSDARPSTTVRTPEPRPAATPPIAPPVNSSSSSGLRPRPPGEAPTNPAKPSAMAGRAGARPEDKPVTPSLPAVNVSIRGELQDDDDDDEAKTIPAQGLPEELKALRERLKQRAVQTTAASTPNVDRATDIARPAVPPRLLPEASTDPRGGTSESPALPSKSVRNPYEDDDDDAGAKTAIALPFGPASPRPSTRPSGPPPGLLPREPQTAGASAPAITMESSQTLQPVDTTVPGPRHPKAAPRPAPKSNAGLVVLLVVTLLLTAVGVLYLLDLPPFHHGPGSSTAASKAPAEPAAPPAANP